MKRQRITNSLLAVAVIAGALAVGCKKVKLSCMYVVTPYVQETKEGTDRLAAGVVGYAFYADTSGYYVASYDDAEAGRLTALDEGGAPKIFDLKAEQGADGRLRLGPIVRQPVLVVLCDTESRIYAWRQIPVEADLPEILVNVRFRPWKTEREYVEARWTMVNETPPGSDPEPDPEPGSDPDQPGDGGE